MPNIEGISIQKSSAERKSYVVVGAILSCSSGSRLSRLKMPFSHGVFVKGKPQMNIMDFVPNINIMPFGKCNNLKNPAVASATAANNGVLTPMPCTPVMTMPWIDGKPDKMVGGHPALLNKSTNMCFHCGLIKIEDDGQDLGGVTIGNQSSANSGPSDASFGQGPACEKPQEKPTMWDNFVKGISKLGDVPAAMQKAASELPGALEKAANDLPKGLQKAAEDLPKGVNLFVQESYVKPIQEDLDTLRDDQLNLADADAVGGIVFAALTVGRSKNAADLWDGLANVNKRKVDINKNTKFSEMGEEQQLNIAKEYRKNAPIEIPENANMKAKSMNDGYEQITYKWNDGTYKYEVRWHTRTSGAPVDQGNTWVIQRTIPGSGGQKPKSFYKIGENEWVEGYKWYEAIAARKAGTATPEQVRILDQGHWKE
ncbi:uncharacterized protein DUF4280 [Brevibacillus sp. AG162]|nr:DUF4280 domain-containing protein [Brevibacillus sp. AG162]TQK62413.1 uncharacterized protein DUF4280 [Brevibacillus sp. AG162]